MNAAFERLDTGNTSRVTAVDVAPSGRRVVVGQRGDARSGIALALWPLPPGPGPEVLIREPEATPRAARFSPGGDLLVYADGADRLAIHDLRTNLGDRSAFPMQDTRWLSFAWNCDRLVAGGSHTAVWDARTSQTVWIVPTQPHAAEEGIRVPVCALSPDGWRLFASGLEPGCIVAFDLPSGEVSGRLRGTIDEARSMDVDPTGHYLAAVGQEGGAGLWDLATGRQALPEILDMDFPYYRCARFHPDGGHLGLGLWSGFVHLLHVQSGQNGLRQEEPPHRGIVNDISFSRDGSRLCSGGEDGAVLLWDLRALKP